MSAQPKIRWEESSEGKSNGWCLATGAFVGDIGRSTYGYF